MSVWGRPDPVPWPPPEVKDRWQTVSQYRARYRSNRLEMIKADANTLSDQHKMDILRPVPLPRELARFSSALLFSQPPAVINLDYRSQIERLLRVNDIGSVASIGGVKVAAEGTVGLRVIRDSAVSPSTPLITVVPDDQIIWDVRHDFFVVGGTVVVTRKDPDKEGHVYRLLECHQPGLITRELYRGENNERGTLVPLTRLPEFASLSPYEPTGLDMATLVRWENAAGGESDFFGLGPLFDTLTEAESTLLDRSRKSEPRLFVDRSLTDDAGVARIDGVILTGGSRVRPTLGKEPGELVHVVEPKYLSKEHIEWIDHLTQLIVTCAGYSPDTWGIQGKTASIQRAVSGYAMKLAMLRTLLTRAGKEHTAKMAWSQATALGIAWLAGVPEVSSVLPIIELGDGMPSDPLSGAQEVLALRQAVAASTEQLVRIVHPAWDDLHVGAEVERIMEEKILAAGGDVPLNQDLLEGDPEDASDPRNVPV